MEITRDSSDQTTPPNHDSEGRTRVATVPVGEGSATRDPAGGYVNAGSVCAFVEGVTLAHRQAVLDTCLLAQLASDKTFGRFTQVKRWFGRYVEVLSSVGWSASEISYSPYQPTGKHVSLQTVVLNAFDKHPHSPSAEVVAKSINALEDLPRSSQGVVHFDGNAQGSAATDATGATVGNFQIVAAYESGGALSMILGAYQYSTPLPEARILSRLYPDAEVRIWQSFQTATLDESMYGRVRSEITHKLQGLVGDYVSALDI